MLTATQKTIINKVLLDDAAAAAWRITNKMYAANRISRLAEGVGYVPATSIDSIYALVCRGELSSNRLFAVAPRVKTSGDYSDIALA